MGGKVTSGRNCEKETGSHRCQGKNCRVRTECEDGKITRQRLEKKLEEQKMKKSIVFF